MTPIVYQKVLILAFNNKITFVKSQHTETTNTKGYFVLKKLLYIRNLKYAHLTSIFQQQNIHLVSSICQHKYK